MEKAFIVENEKARNKLILLAKTIKDDDFKKEDGEGWTIGVVFAHIAFWDQRTLILLGRWKNHGVIISPVDTDVINESLTPFLKAIQPLIAINMALSTAEILCREIEKLPDELIIAIENLGDKMRLRRHQHWQMHIEQIEKIIRS